MQKKTNAALSGAFWFAIDQDPTWPLSRPAPTAHHQVVYGMAVGLSKRFGSFSLPRDQLARQLRIRPDAAIAVVSWLETAGLLRCVDHDYQPGIRAKRYMLGGRAA